MVSPWATLSREIGTQAQWSTEVVARTFPIAFFAATKRASVRPGGWPDEVVKQSVATRL